MFPCNKFFDCPLFQHIGMEHKPAPRRQQPQHHAAPGVKHGPAPASVLQQMQHIRRETGKSGKPAQHAHNHKNTRRVVYREPKRAQPANAKTAYNIDRKRSPRITGASGGGGYPGARQIAQPRPYKAARTCPQKTK